MSRKNGIDGTDVSIGEKIVQKGRRIHADGVKKRGNGTLMEK
jgi:hypothetical protein